MQLISMANMHIFGLWEEAGVPGGNQPRHMENMQTPHRKAMRALKQGPCCCEVVVLTATVPTHLCKEGNKFKLLS